MNYDLNEGFVQKKDKRKNNRNITKEILIQKIERQEVVEEIDKNNTLIKAFRGKYKKNNNSVAKNVIFGYGCNWNECHFIECKRVRILAHIMSKHTKEKPFQCNECEYKTHLKKLLRNHILIIHPLNPINETKRIFKCDFNGCQFIGWSEYVLKLHKNRHIGIKRYACVWPSCESSFITSTELKLHLTVHSEERPYLCDWPGCEATFKSSGSLYNHKKIHIGLKPYLCDWTNCEAKFHYESQLIRHKSIHTGVKKWVCNWPECAKSFCDKCSLDNHILVHQNIRPFECLLKGCDRRFFKKRHMIRHYNNHK